MNVKSNTTCIIQCWLRCKRKWECHLSSCVHVSGASGILREYLLSSCVHVTEASGILCGIHFLVVCPCFRSVWHLAGNAFYRRVSTFQERLGHFTGMTFIVVCPCLRSVWHFKGISQFHSHAQYVQAVCLAGHTSSKHGGLYE